MDFRYNIHAFRWIKVFNAFFVDNPIPGMHPIGRDQFYITNSDTGGFRRFRYVRTLESDVIIESNTIYNVFESEDGIKCFVKSLNNKK